MVRAIVLFLLMLFVIFLLPAAYIKFLFVVVLTLSMLTSFLQTTLVECWNKLDGNVGELSRQVHEKKYWFRLVHFELASFNQKEPFFNFLFHRSYNLLNCLCFIIDYFAYSFSLPLIFLILHTNTH